MPSELHTGSTIAGRYALGEVIGRGGMGTVRAGRDLRLQRDVAVKLLHPELAALPRTRARFEAEARAAAGLAHPNIVVVYDSGEHDGVPYLVMERLPGATLADELVNGPLPIERVCQVGAGVLAALGAAHAAGIVHRDVKPGNVLVCPDGAVKVADFGIAKSVDATDLTTAGMLIGTPAYLSPEQLAGQAATPASDIYAVGVLLYEALTGRKPFVAESAIALARRVETEQPAPVTELRPETPAELASAIARAMEKDPSRRFGSADEMAAALKSAPAPDTAHATTEPLARTQRSGTATQRRAGWPEDRLGARRGRRSAQGGRQFVLLVAGVLAVVLVLASLLAARDDAPGPAREPTPTTAAPPASSLPPELDRALHRLEEAVRP